MSARDVVPKHLLKPNQMVWIVGPSYCANLFTEILTQRGWLKYDEIQEGDQTLSIDPSTGLSEWDTIEGVHYFPGEHDVVRMEGQSLAAVTTPNHRWLTHRLPKADGRLKSIGWQWRTTETLTTNDRIPCAVPHLGFPGPDQQKYTDAFVELAAWIWIEGHIYNGSGFVITQSHTVNEPNCARIRKALLQICPEPNWAPHSNNGLPYWSEKIVANKSEWSDKPFTQFRIGNVLGREFWKVFLLHKVVDPQFILALTEAQLRLFVDVSLAGDGSINRGRSRNYDAVFQENAERLFAVQLACTLLGIRTSLKQRGDGQWVLGVLTQSFVCPTQSRASQRCKDPSKGMQIVRETTDGVWCPKTKNGTWLAKYKGSVYFTGNTLAEKEFRQVWNDLIVKKKLGKDRRVKKSYSVRTGAMEIKLPWNSEVICKSAEQSDLLVGEGLDHVIMSEAAKHRRETWERFIRPSLADRRGSADLNSTPEGYNWYYDLFQLGRNPELPDYWCAKYPSWMNPYVYPGGREDDEVKLLEATMDHEYFMQEVGADFASFAGKIFPDWDEFEDVKPHEFNPAYRSYMTVDYGYSNYMAAVEFQVSPTDQVYVWRVWYKKFKTIPDMARELKAQEQPPGYHLDLIFGDPADPQAGATLSEEMDVQVYAPKDLKARFTWLDGIMLMRGFMKHDRQVSEDEYGTPFYESSFYVDPRCTPVIKELSSYRSREPIKGQNVPELGVKADDHTIDAMRYALLCIFKLGAVKPLEDSMVSGETRQPAVFRRESALVAASASDMLDTQHVLSSSSAIFGADDPGTFTWGMDF